MKVRTILITAVIVLSGSLKYVSAQNTIEKESPVVKTQQARFGDLVGNQVNLQYLNTFDISKTKLLVMVEEQSGELLYSKRFLRKRNLDIELDISDFPKGDYTFKLYNKKELVCSRVITKQTCVPVEKCNARQEIKDVSTFLKTRQTHIISRTNSHVNLQFFDTIDENCREMEVRIFEESDNLLFSDSYFRKGDLNIDFNISNFPKGDYTFQFFNKDELVCSKVITKQAEMQNENLVAILYTKDK